MKELPLYWTDPDCLESETAVTEDAPGDLESDDRTSCRMIRLDMCPFFPGGGGQAPDRGSVGGRDVLGIYKDESGVVLKIAGEEPFARDSRVKCLIDADHRWQSRQQHSGQHLISAALASEGLETLSVHLGEGYCGIEVNAESVPDSVIERVLNRCDTWISPGRPINSLVLSPADIAGRNLRRPLNHKTAVAGRIKEDQALPDTRGPKTGAVPVGPDREIRIIEIEGIDEVGCGGVHLKNTCSIRLVLFGGTEKIRGHVRLKWLIGEQAVKEGRILSDQGRRIQSQLSVPAVLMAERVAELAEGARAAQTALNNAEKEIGRLIAVSAEKMLADDRAPLALVLEGGKERLEGALDLLRGRARDRVVFLAGSADANGSAPWGLLYGGTDSDRFFVDFRKEFLPEIDGKGGGGPPLMRGHLGADPREAVLKFERFLDEYKAITTSRDQNPKKFENDSPLFKKP